MAVKVWLRWPVLLVAVFGGAFLLGQGVPVALSEPGSPEDPLVTKGYVDRYLQEAATGLSGRLQALEARVKQLEEQLGKRITLTVNSTTAYVGFEPVPLEVAPFMENGRTMLPFRFVGEALGARVTYDATANTVGYELGSARLVLQLNSSGATLDGKAVTITPAPYTLDGRTVVPVRVISEFLRATVDWVEQTQTIIITPRAGPEES